MREVEFIWYNDQYDYKINYMSKTAEWYLLFFDGAGLSDDIESMFSYNGFLTEC